MQKYFCFFAPNTLCALVVALGKKQVPFSMDIGNEELMQECLPKYSLVLTASAGFIGGRWGQLPLAPLVMGAPLQVWNLQVWTVSLSHTGHIVTYYHYYALAALPFNMPMVRKLLLFVEQN